MEPARSPVLLDVLSRLLDAHSMRSEGEPLNLVRVALVGDDYQVDDSDRTIPDLLDAASGFSRVGRSFDASRAQTGADLTACDPVLTATLFEAMKVDRPARDPLVFDLNDGQLTLGGQSLDVLGEGGHVELLGLVAALLDPRWDGAELGIVSYAEGSMDPLTRLAVRRGLSAIGGSVKVGTLRTLIVIARAPTVLIDHHCHAEAGAQYVVDGRRAILRRPITHVRAAARGIVRTVEAPRVFFLGAGFNFSSSLPLGNTLRDWALRHRYAASRDAPVHPLAIKLFRESHGLIEDGGDEASFAKTLTLEEVVALDTALAREISPALDHFAQIHSRATPGEAVTQFAQLVPALSPTVIVTVNFDELLETVSDASALRVFTTESEFGEFPEYLTRYLAGDEAGIPMLKLHGTISDPESCVINATITSAPLPPVKAGALRALHQGAVITGGSRPNWVYIGASLRDKDIVPVLLRDESFPEAFEEYWVMPLRETSIEEFGRTRDPEWRKSGRPSIDDRTISATADLFVRLMVDSERDQLS